MARWLMDQLPRRTHVTSVNRVAIASGECRDSPVIRTVDVHVIGSSDTAGTVSASARLSRVHGSESSVKFCETIRTLFAVGPPGPDGKRNKLVSMRVTPMPAAELCEYEFTDAHSHGYRIAMLSFRPDNTRSVSVTEDASDSAHFPLLQDELRGLVTEPALAAFVPRSAS